MDKFYNYAQAAFTPKEGGGDEGTVSSGFVESLLVRIRGTHVDLKAEQGDREAAMYLNKSLRFLN